MKINSSLQLHRIVVVLIYLIAFYLTREVLALPEAQKDLLTTLSSGALLATFGSAVGSICLIWQNDLIQRINLNIEILYKDIHLLSQEAHPPFVKKLLHFSQVDPLD